ncbi:GH1 family beta-glucosidase [Candidatus Contendibacter odensensis]|uniref:Beta-glucosidase n=1 Tax=Candidatus Contendobacter odensis Run_B_J11 TaxID=1400861 RepID=A0A7U7GCA1_9GAMM|nr:GH1 family beta-glucosidase [Candidatus Contendobacter odensis]CDH45781.1 Beta-glucosidase A [Candidatus Contendobacter odensis Run_B_J11]
MSAHSLFPADFLWGTATSAYQIEGSPLADGAGPSIWHEFAHTPGRVRHNETGDVACDHYHRYRDDVALMRELGLNAYRFSVSWSRVLPEGRGLVNRCGLDFYQRLVDALLEQGIQPMVTLYHWDLPAALDRRGGWLNPESAHWFADYAQVLFRALDDRVKLWVTLNEPWVIVDGGYLHGALAPGQRNPYAAPIAAHHLLRAHAAAVQAYRAEGRHQIGLVVNLEPKYPATETVEDLNATMRADADFNRHYLDPVFLGSYPPELAEIFGPAWPVFPESDLDFIRQPLDFLGINYYSRQVVRHDPNAWPLAAAKVRQDRQTHTGLDWEVYPQGLTDILQWVASRYGSLPLYITENGAAFYDPPQANNGEVDDPLRRRYLRDHLCAALAAQQNGVNLRGYFAWSLLDNFEWAHGYSQRFGLIHVDYATQQRTFKASARFYTEVIRSHGAALVAGSAGK